MIDLFSYIDITSSIASSSDAAIRNNSHDQLPSAKTSISQEREKDLTFSTPALMLASEYSPHSFLSF